MRTQTTKSKVKRIFEAYNHGLITLGEVISQLERIRSETILKRFAEKLEVYEKENNNV